MAQNWDNIKWIFKSYQSGLRDIYIQETSLADWEQLIDFFNLSYNLNFGEESANQIDKDYVINYLNGNTAENENKRLRIELDGVNIHCYFFLKEEIEFDIDPNDIMLFSDFEKLEDFMTAISKVLKKQVTLTGENDPKFPLIKIDFEKDIHRILTNKEAKALLKRQNSILYRPRYLESNLINLFSLKIFKTKLFRNAGKVYKPTRISENMW